MRKKLSIGKTHGGYFRVYDEISGDPFSPREFTNKADARNWIKKNKNYKGYYYDFRKKGKVW